MGYKKHMKLMYELNADYHHSMNQSCWRNKQLNDKKRAYLVRKRSKQVINILLGRE